MSLVIDEAKPTKVAAVYRDEQTANTAKQHLIDEGGFTADAVSLVRPDDENLSKKIEPEDGQVAGTLVKSHITLGFVGLAIGVIVAFILVSIGPAMTQSSPLLTFLALAFVGTMLGMMFAGVVSIRPDQDPLITQTVEATQNYQWTVVVQAKNKDEADRAESLLAVSALSVQETL